MLTYTEAKDLMASARDPYGGKPLGNNTRLYQKGEDFAVRLHATDVVILHPDGTYTLDSGGWRTPTTKQRINEYSPARLYQAKNEWFVFGSHWQVWDNPNYLNVPFYDGLRVGPNGLPTDPAPAEAQAAVAAKQRYHKAVNRYIRGWLDHLRAEWIGKGLPQPSNGDCWYCLMFDQTLDNPDHILSHFGGTDDQPEPYFVPAFLWDAIRQAGYVNPDFILSMLDADLKQGRTDLSMVRIGLRRFFKSKERLYLPAFIAAGQ